MTASTLVFAAAYLGASLLVGYALGFIGGLNAGREQLRKEVLVDAEKRREREALQ